MAGPAAVSATMGTCRPPSTTTTWTASTPMDAYDYGLPDSAIAQSPVEPRSSARLLIGPGVTDGPVPARATVADLAGLLRPGDVLVVNDTRVLAARLSLVKATGGQAEVLLIEPLGRGDGGADRADVGAATA